MNERTLSEAIGIDAGAVEALGRAGVQTVQQLIDADPDTVAMASGIPVDRFRDWQQTARGSAARPGPSPAAKGWMVGVIGIVIAILLGWALIAIGSHRIAQAEKTRVASESKLQVAVSSAANDAIEQLRQARLAINATNWGSAQTALSKVDAKVTLIKQTAPDNLQSDADELRKLMDDVLNAVTQQSPDASAKLDALEAALDKMGQGRK